MSSMTTVGDRQLAAELRKMSGFARQGLNLDGTAFDLDLTRPTSFNRASMDNAASCQNNGKPDESYTMSEATEED